MSGVKPTGMHHEKGRKARGLKKVPKRYGDASPNSGYEVDLGKIVVKK